MKRIVSAILFLTFVISLPAQEILHLYNGSSVIFEKSVSEIDSIHFQGSQSIFNLGNDYLTFPVSVVDSITFSNESLLGDDIYITWNGNNVNIINPYANNGVTITNDGAKVTVTVTSTVQDIIYHLSGNSSDGYLYITPNKRFTLSLEGLSLTNSEGPAIDVLVDKKTNVILADGSQNFLNDGTGNTKKAALQSKSELIFYGNGTLTLNGYKRNGIHSDDYVQINSGNIVVASAAADGIHCDYFVMNGGSVNITASGDGIDGDTGFMEVNDGTITINISDDDKKGMKCDSTITINGGSISINNSGDQSKGLKSGLSTYINGGNLTINATGTYVSETTTSGVDLSYCTGIKTGKNLIVTNGEITITCPTTNAGSKAISCDSNIVISGGTLNLTSLGSCAKYLVSGSTYDSYASACLKANGDITISGGNITATAGGRSISCDGNYTQTGGRITASTNAIGFTVMGTGSSCTDGFAPACLKADGNIVFTAGGFSGTSTGKGGRGIVADGTLTLGVTSAEDSLLVVYVTTSGAPVNASSGGGGWPPGGGGSSDYWKGLPKGVKIEGNITVNSGHLQSYCSQTSGSSTGEAIESKASLYVNGGSVEANACDDAINANSYIQINGGQVWAYSRGNDGIDCNGTRVDINGGTVIARGSEVAVDDNGDHGGKMYITGGTIILIGGNMGSTEATPSVTGQKGVTLSSGGGGGGWPGGGGSGGGSTLASNGFCLKNSSGTILHTFKWPTFSGSGFINTPMPVSQISDNNTTTDVLGNTPKTPNANSGIYISSPSIQAGTYTYFSSPTITGGTQWHGLYAGATVTTSGNGTSVTAQ